MTNIISLVCFVISAFIFYYTDNPDYWLLFLEPLIFGLIYGLNFFLQNNKFECLALGVVFTTSFLRFVVTPLVMCLAGYPKIVVDSCSAYIGQAVLLQLYEEVCILLVISYFAPKIYKSQYNSEPVIEENVMHWKNNIVIIAIILFALMLCVVFPSLLSRFHFIFSMVGNESEDVIEKNAFSGLGVFVSIGRILFVLYALSYLFCRYQYTSQKKYIIYSLLLVGINASIAYDMSRFSSLMPIVVTLYFLSMLYPFMRKKIITWGVIIGSACISFLTFVKMFSKYRGDSSNSTNIKYWAMNLQCYFQGINDICIGISASHKIHKFPVSQFFNDIISNMMFLSKISDSKSSSLKIFNVEYNGWWVQDKILPNVCAGYIYAGFIGAPLINCILTFFAMKFDDMSRNAADVRYKYLYIFAALPCCFGNMIFYPMIVGGSLVNSVLLIFIVMKINDKLKW